MLRKPDPSEQGLWHRPLEDLASVAVKGGNTSHPQASGQGSTEKLGILVRGCASLGPFTLTGVAREGREGRGRYLLGHNHSPFSAS